MEILSPSLTSCQYVAGQLLETSARSPLSYLSLIPLLLLLKILLSLFAQRLKFTETRTTSATIPVKLVRLLEKHQVPVSRIVLTETNQFEAYVLGIVQPSIVLSRQLVKSLSPKQLEAVVLHELYHFHNYHPLLFLLSSACSSVCWFLPTITELSELIQERCELAADSFSVTTQGTKRYLVQALRVCLLQPIPRQTLQWQLVSTPSLYKQLLQERINSLSDMQPIQKQHFQYKNILVSTAVLVLLLGLALIKPTDSIAAQAPNKCTFAECVAQCVSERLGNSRQYSPGLYSPADVE